MYKWRHLIENSLQTEGFNASQSLDKTIKLRAMIISPPQSSIPDESQRP